MVDGEALPGICQVEPVTGLERNTLMGCQLGAVGKISAICRTQIRQQHAIFPGGQQAVTAADTGGIGGEIQVAVGISSQPDFVIQGNPLSDKTALRSHKPELAGSGSSPGNILNRCRGLLRCGRARFDKQDGSQGTAAQTNGNPD